MTGAIADMGMSQLPPANDNSSYGNKDHNIMTKQQWNKRSNNKALITKIRKK